MDIADGSLIVLALVWRGMTGAGALAGLVPRVVDIEAFALARASGQDFVSFTPGRRVDSAQWAVDIQGMGVACGLALRSFA